MQKIINDILNKKILSPTKTLRLFSIISFCVLTLMILAIGNVMSLSMKNSKIDEIRRSASDFVEVQIQSHLTSDLFLSDIRPEAFEAFSSNVRTAEVFHIVIFNDNSTVIFSEQKGLIGTPFLPTEEYLAAMQGNIIAVIEELDDDPDHILDPGHEQFMELYVPVRFNGSKNIVGIVEIYYDIDNLNSSISRSKKLV